MLIMLAQMKYKKETLSWEDTFLYRPFFFQERSDLALSLKNAQLFCNVDYFFNIIEIDLGREFWTIFRGPGFLAVVGFGSSPIPLPRSPVSKMFLFSISVFLFVAGRA